MTNYVSKICAEDEKKILQWIKKNPESSIAEIQARWTIVKSVAERLRREAGVPPPVNPWPTPDDVKRMRSVDIGDPNWGVKFGRRRWGRRRA